jgi:hypothetical protein
MSDGLVESLNKTVIEMLSKYVTPNQRNWDEILPLAMMAYRSSKHESLNLTPNMMMLGREVDLPIDLLFPPPEEISSSQTPNDYVQSLIEKMNSLHGLAREKLVESCKKQKRLYDRKISKHSLHVDDPVWLRIFIHSKGLSKKLSLNWDGPYKVTHKISDVTYKVQKSQRSKPKIVHFNRLKPYKGSLPDNWFSR